MMKKKIMLMLFILSKSNLLLLPIFLNKGERIAKCLISVGQSDIYPENEKACYFNDIIYHENKVANIAGGLNNNVIP